MATINYGTKELVCKIVYYGPGYGGKTTNLQKIHELLPDEAKGDLTSLATAEDRTLFFDLLPMDMGKVGEFFVKVRLYTVPGQVKYSATRRVVLNGVDGVVIVFDSDPAREAANYTSLSDLGENLATYGLNVDEIPIVFQYNKRDLPNAMDLGKMREALNPERKFPEFEATAVQGDGVQETVRQVCSMVLARIGGEMPSITRRTRELRRDPARARAEATAAVGARARTPDVATEEFVPPVRARKSGRWRQMCELRLGQFLIGHATLDVNPASSAGAAAEEFAAELELRPMMGARKRHSATLRRGGPAGAKENRLQIVQAEIEGIPTARAFMKDGGEEPARVYMEWPTRLGTLRILPEGEVKMSSAAARPDLGAAA